MTNYKVTVLRDRNDPGTKMTVNILANSEHEARQKALASYGAKGSVIAVIG